MNNLHYTKSGALDMRYNSSRAAISSGYYGGSNNYNAPGGYSSGHFGSTSSYRSPRYQTSDYNSSGLILKKDGTPDMRYKSSKNYVANVARSHNQGYHQGSSDFHLKKDRTLDMRFNSSKAAVAAIKSAPSDTGNLSKEMARMLIGNKKSTMIPSNIPLTKQGLPDMRTTAAKQWVAQQAQICPADSVPAWLPRLKDDSIDTTKAVCQGFLKSIEGRHNYDPDMRANYYCKKMANDYEFSKCVEQVRQDHIDINDILNNLINNINLPEKSILKKTVNHLDITRQLREQDCLEIKYSNISIGTEELGKGGFGVVMRGRWSGKEVAVKKMHLQKLTNRDKKAFLTEVNILSNLKHDNLVELFGYTLEPMCLVLEFVPLGDLNDLLHYDQPPEIEAKITDGRIKKLLLIGITSGMIVLHDHGIVHGDLKPHNILVNRDFVAKISDFGLATLRAKTQASVASCNLLDNDHGIGGTAAYMAVELLDSCDPPHVSSDVYSFGILMNELITEEEPYSDKLHCFLGRGSFGAVNYAKLGNRPRMSKNMGANLADLIRQCWHGDADMRPTFKQIYDYLVKPSMTIPNSF